MTIIKNKNFRIFAAVLVFVVCGYYLMQWFTKNYVKDLVANKLPPNISIEYQEIHVNILTSSVYLTNASIYFKNKVNLKNIANLKLDNFELLGLGYWDLIFNKVLSINNVVLKNPQINYYPYNKNPPKIQKNKRTNQVINVLNFKTIKITNGKIKVMQNSSDNIQLSATSFNLKISESAINLLNESDTPFSFETYDLKANDIILANNDYETMAIEMLTLDTKSCQIINFQILQKYPKTQLSKLLRKERDYIDLKIPKINFKNLDANLFKEKKRINMATAEIIEPNLEVYRDKLLPDDLSIKPLYSKALRNLGLEFSIDTIDIKNGYISYSELVDVKNNAGELVFENVNAHIEHLSNKKNNKKTTVKIQSNLMGTAPLELNWNFDIHDKLDAFDVSGSIHQLAAENLNPFFKPNLNIKAEGTLQQMYFTFYGNNTASQGEIKMKYDDFKFNLLQKDSFKINKVLTAVGNLFISNNSDTNPEGYRFGSIDAERDQTKSFFNYLWINVKSGLVSTLTGNGEK